MCSMYAAAVGNRACPPGCERAHTVSQSESEGEGEGEGESGGGVDGAGRRLGGEGGSGGDLDERAEPVRDHREGREG